MLILTVLKDLSALQRLVNASIAALKNAANSDSSNSAKYSNPNLNPAPPSTSFKGSGQPETISSTNPNLPMRAAPQAPSQPSPFPPYPGSSGIGTTGVWGDQDSYFSAVDRRNWIWAVAFSGCRQVTVCAFFENIILSNIYFSQLMNYFCSFNTRK